MYFKDHMVYATTMEFSTQGIQAAGAALCDRHVWQPGNGFAMCQAHHTGRLGMLCDGQALLKVVTESHAT
jgi:hypothetical protein